VEHDWTATLRTEPRQIDNFPKRSVRGDRVEGASTEFAPSSWELVAIETARDGGSRRIRKGLVLLIIVVKKLKKSLEDGFNLCRQLA
jgi:hypothetical protein